MNSTTHIEQYRYTAAHAYSNSHAEQHTLTGSTPSAQQHKHTLRHTFNNTQNLTDTAVYLYVQQRPYTVVKTV